MYILSRPDEIQLRKLKELNKAVSRLLAFYWCDQGEKRRERRGTKELQGFCHLGMKEELSVAVVILIN